MRTGIWAVATLYAGGVFAPTGVSIPGGGRSGRERAETGPNGAGAYILTVASGRDG